MSRQEKIIIADGNEPMGLNGQLLEGHEDTLLSRFLNDEKALHQYPDLQPKHFGCPVKQEIFKGIRQLSDDGYAVNLLSVQDYFRRRGKLKEIGKATLTTLVADNVAAMDDSCFAYALDCVMDAYRHREATKICKEFIAGKIGRERAQEQFAKLDQHQKTEKSWIDALSESVVTSNELRKLKLTPRRKLLGDWLCEGDYGIIFSPRGVGKTWLGLLIAKTVATGGKLGEWEAPNPSKVLYIDGEMPADLMRDRDKGLGAGDVEFLNHAILFDRCEKVLNITDEALQAAILAKCIRDNVKLLVLDNLSTLASGIKENDSFEWERLHNWLLQFRRHKIAVILIHHAGRNNEARGTSKREDAAFWVIALDDAKKNADDKRGARFISRFTKPSRNTQDEIPPLEWHAVTDTATGEVSVACKAARTMDVFRQLIEDGVSDCGQLSDEMRVSPPTISRMAKKAIDEGWLKKKGREYEIVKGSGDMK